MNLMGLHVEYFTKLKLLLLYFESPLNREFEKKTDLNFANLI